MICENCGAPASEKMTDGFGIERQYCLECACEEQCRMEREYERQQLRKLGLAE